MTWARGILRRDREGYSFLPLSAHIQNTNPAEGYMANWNNSGAPGWWAADGNGTYGPTHRVESLRKRLAAFKASGRKHDLASMIEIAGDAALSGRFDAPRAQGSTFQEGWFQHMRRLMQTALNAPGRVDYRALRCANSSVVADCRAAVLSALDQALADLGGLANQASWDGTQLAYPKATDCGMVEACDSVEHSAFAFQPVPPIHWINRPTYHQAAEIIEDRSGVP